MKKLLIAAPNRWICFASIAFLAAAAFVANAGNNANAPTIADANNVAAVDNQALPAPNVDVFSVTTFNDTAGAANFAVIIQNVKNANVGKNPTVVVYNAGNTRHLAALHATPTAVKIVRTFVV